MEKTIKVITVLLLILLVTASIFNVAFDGNTIKDEESIKLLKMNIELNDKQTIDSLNKSLEKIVNNSEDFEKLKKELKVEETVFKTYSAALGERAKQVVKLHAKDLNTAISNKNDTVFLYEEHRIKNSRINYWLIILIILSAGIIGGWARTNYSLLLPLKNDLQTLVKKMLDIRNDIIQKNDAGDGHMDILGSSTPVGQKTDELESKIEKILTELPTKAERVNTSIIFGVIASSISILALKLTDSNVLNFNDNIDYFILWAWCLLGAVYAKDSIEKIYNKNFGAENNA